ncbi:KAT8 regulatory NSL complex subunit 1-like protein isoform X2 [Pyxicephalus adspersus]|uniref:KAT8 regulatory NSL complex subunit 1-like protein isoform X2 n=1 Tax=Pyxicephalus adspersus TaxID=30357 RepID=UPI003B59E15B
MIGKGTMCLAKIEKDNCRQRFFTSTDNHLFFAERKVKRKLFPGTVSQVLADVNKFWDLSVTEAEGMHGSPGPKYRLHGRIEGECLSVPLASIYSSPDFTNQEKRPQTLPNKENQVKSPLMRCLNQQQVLINRAERNRKRLQMLLASIFAENCRQQISDFVSFQSKKTKLNSNPNGLLSNDTKINDDASGPSNVATITCNHWKKQDFKKYKMTSAAGKLSESMPGILANFERQLDSDATESSSDEDWDEKTEKIYNSKAELNWLSIRASVGSRWAWLQGKISELEYQIQELDQLHNQLRSQKEALVFEEPSDSILKRNTHSPGHSLRPAGRLATPREGTNLSSPRDLEMSPSSPTMLLRNIEKQSAQLSEMFSSLMAFSPITLSPKSHSKSEYGAPGFPAVGRMPEHKVESPWFNGFSQKQPKERKRIHAKGSSTFGSSSARTRPLQLYHKRNLYIIGSECTAMLSHKAVYCCNESVQISNPSSTWTCCDKLQKPVLAKSNVCELEPHFHPVLSLPSDIPLCLHLGSLLKNREIRGDAVDNNLFLKEENGHQLHDTHSSPESVYDPCKDEGSSSKVNDSDTVTLNSFNNATQTEDSSTMTPTSQKSSSQTRDSVVGSGKRRLRSGSSYDIDNIVIPMNLVAPIKLEKLQYKEIITPSYKEVIYKPLDIPPNEELEDLSDDAYSRRHEKYEQREKGRWSFWQNNKCPKKSRSHEEDSPGYFSQISCDTKSPNRNEPQNQQLDELQHDKVEQWERRVFPLTEAALALVNTHKEIQNSSITTHVENREPPITVQ